MDRGFRNLDLNFLKILVVLYQEKILDLQQSIYITRSHR